MRMDKSKEKHANVFPYVYMHTPTDIQTYINTDRHMQNMFYSFQIVLFDIMLESI